MVLHFLQTAAKINRKNAWILRRNKTIYLNFSIIVLIFNKSNIVWLFLVFSELKLNFICCWILKLPYKVLICFMPEYIKLEFVSINKNRNSFHLYVCINSLHTYVQSWTKKKSTTRCYSYTDHRREMKLVPFFMVKCPH